MSAPMRAGLAAAMLALLAACGTGGDAPQRSGVTLRGMVFSDHFVDIPCPEQAADPARPSTLSGIGIAFHDGAGAELGSATTGELRWDQLDYGCRFYASYQAALPEAATYRAEFTPPPRVEFAWGYYSGAEELQPQQATLDELAALGFTWDFQASSSYVVID